MTAHLSPSRTSTPGCHHHRHCAPCSAGFRVRLWFIELGRGGGADVRVGGGSNVSSVPRRWWGRGSDVTCAFARGRATASWQRTRFTVATSHRDNSGSDACGTNHRGSVCIPRQHPVTLMQTTPARLFTRGPIYKISYDLSYNYRKFIVRSTEDSDLKHAEISLRNIVS